MELEKSTSRSKGTGRISAFCPTALSIYRVFGFTVLMGLMSFVILPGKDETIKAFAKTISILKTEVSIWKTKATKLEQIIFRKDLIIQRKDKENARLKIKAENSKIVHVEKKEIQYVKKQLTYSDSLVIARRLSDTIYAEIIEKARRKVAPIQVK